MSAPNYRIRNGIQTERTEPMTKKPFPCWRYSDGYGRETMMMMMMMMKGMMNGMMMKKGMAVLAAGTI